MTICFISSKCRLQYKFKLEFVIRALRRELFLHFKKYGEINGINQLLTSMSKQMLLNEFIYDETNLESEKVRNIEREFKAKQRLR